VTSAAAVSIPPLDAPPSWGQSLAAGATGIALLHIELARLGVASWNVAHDWVSAAVRHPVTAHPDACGLFRGVPAVAFVLQAAAQPAYANALARLDDHIASVTRYRLELAHQRIDCSQTPELREFDLINGLTGLGVYLLHRGRDDLLQEVLAYLVRLTGPLKVEEGVLPGWWCGRGPGNQPDGYWLGGHANLGMAHGIAGPLALLATTMRRGIGVLGQPEAIDRICQWLDRWRGGTDTRPWWPETISRAEWRAGATQWAGPGRPSWCYGTPGLARAQQLAAIALDNPSRQRQAERALLTCITDQQQLAQLRDASVCHGWAGLLQTTWRTALDADSPLIDHLPRLQARLQQQERAAQDGLLEGMAGIQLVEHTITTNSPPLTGWDTCLLLSG
jgi:lantibiotic biosynthesis protein